MYEVDLKGLDRDKVQQMIDYEAARVNGSSDLMEALEILALDPFCDTAKSAHGVFMRAREKGYRFMLYRLDGEPTDDR